MGFLAQLRRPLDWLLLTGKRRIVILALFCFVFAVLVGVGTVATVEIVTL